MNDIVQALLAEKAAKWLDRLVHLGNEPTDWSEFKDTFLKQYSVLDDESKARDKLKEARQQGKVATYVEYFNEIILLLPSATNADLVHSFVYGLKQPIKGLVKAHVAQASDPPLEDVMVLALSLEESTKDNPQNNFQKQVQNFRRGPNPNF